VGNSHFCCSNEGAYNAAGKAFLYGIVLRAVPAKSKTAQSLTTPAIFITVTKMI